MRLRIRNRAFTVCCAGTPQDLDGMDGECAFCGRADVGARQVYCDDCQQRHTACVACAAEVSTDESDVYHVVA